MALLTLRSPSRPSHKYMPLKNVAGRVALFFALVVSMTAIGSSTTPRISHALSSGGLTFTEINGESWELTGCDDTCATDIVIPSSVDGKPVTSISSSIFYATQNINRVELPASIMEIGTYPFFYSSVATIAVNPASQHFKVVGNMLLNKTGSELVGYASGSSSTSLTIPDGVTKLRQGAISSNTLTSISLPESLQEIGVQAIKVSGLLTIELPASLSIIGYDAFTPSLTSFTVNAGNTTFSTTDGVLFKGSTLFRYPAARSDTSYSVPAGTTDIEPEAFRNASFLDSLNLPASISTLTGASLSGLSNLASINVNASNTTFSSNDGVLFRGNTLVRYPSKKVNTSYSVPSGITEIGEAAFDSATLLTSLLLPDSLRIIGFNGLVRMSGLTSIDLPTGLTTLGAYALAVTGLTSVVIPHTVTNWGGDVFSFTQVFESVYFEGDAPPVSAFGYITPTAKIHRIVGTAGWPALGDQYGGLEQVAWTPAITTPRAPSVEALGESVRVTANRGSGGLPTSYLVTASPGGRTCTIATGESSCVVTTLTAGTPYTFTTTATKGSTTTTSSVASAAISPLSSQSISFTGPIDREFSPTPLTVNPTANSNLSVTLTSLTQDVCTVSGFNVSMLTVGTCTLAASQAGNATYAAATDVVHSFTIIAVQETTTTTPAPTTTTPAPTTTTPLLRTIGTSVSIARKPSSAVATAVAIGVNKTKVMIALKVPTATKAANQVTKYIIQLKAPTGVTIIRTIAVRAGSSVSPTLTGKKKTSYSMTVTSVTRSGKKTTWNGPQIKTP